MWDLGLHKMESGENNERRQDMPWQERVRLTLFHTSLITLATVYFQTGRESDKMDNGIEKTYTLLY